MKNTKIGKRSDLEDEREEFEVETRSIFEIREREIDQQIEVGRFTKSSRRHAKKKKKTNGANKISNRVQKRRLGSGLSSLWERKDPSI